MRFSNGGRQKHELAPRKAGCDFSDVLSVGSLGRLHVKVIVFCEPLRMVKILTSGNG